MSKKDLIAFEIPHDLLEKVDKQAEKEQRTRSAMLRIIISKHFEKASTDSKTKIRKE